MDPTTTDGREAIALSVFGESSDRCDAIKLQHQDITNTLALLRENVGTPKRDLERRIAHVAPPLTISALLHVAVDFMVMINPDAGPKYEVPSSLGSYRPSPWLPEESLVRFLEHSFPQSIRRE